MSALSKYENVCHPMYMIVSGGFNVPSLVFGILGFLEWCNYYSNWLVGNAIFSGLNLVLSIYSVYKIRSKMKQNITTPRTVIEEGISGEEKTGDDETDSNSNNITEDGNMKQNITTPRTVDVEDISGEEKTGDDETDSNSNNITEDGNEREEDTKLGGCFSRLIHLRTPSSDRIRHLICYDKIVGIYSILFVFWVFWLSEGVQRILQESIIDEEEQFEGCLPYHERYMKTSVVCGFVYVGFVMVAGLVSLCTKNKRRR